MADRYINLKELLPLYLQAYKEVAATTDADIPVRATHGNPAQGR